MALCAVLASSRARADGASNAEADALVARGIELREQGKDDQALEVFRKADALAPAPRTHAQVALAEQALGIWVPAEAHLREALASKDPWIERYRATLSGALETIRQHVGLLEVRGGVAGADVYVDGARIGSLPMIAPWHVEVGRRALAVRAQGYYTASRATDIAPGQTTRETVELVRDDSGGDAPARAQGAAGEAQRPVDGSAQRMVGWILLGTGGAALVGGVGALITRKIAVDAYNGDASCPGLGNATQPQPCQDRISTADTWLTVATWSFVIAGALTAGGVIVVLTAPPSRAAPAAARAACGPAGIGVACAGTF